MTATAYGVKLQAACAAALDEVGPRTVTAFEAVVVNSEVDAEIIILAMRLPVGYHPGMQ